MGTTVSAVGDCANGRCDATANGSSSGISGKHSGGLAVDHSSANAAAVSSHIGSSFDGSGGSAVDGSGSLADDGSSGSGVQAAAVAASRKQPHPLELCDYRLVTPKVTALAQTLLRYRVSDQILYP